MNDILINKLLKEIERRHNIRNSNRVLRSGYRDLDGLMPCGFKPGELIIIASRPSVGHTAFAMNIVNNIMTDTDATAVILDLSGSAEKLLMRLLSLICNIQAWSLLNGNMSDEQMARITNGIGKLSDYNLIIDNTPALSCAEIRSRCLCFYQEHKPNLILITDISLVRVDEEHENRDHEMQVISHSLKELAVEINVPVIAVTPVNVIPESRIDYRPQISDLHAHTAIERNADTIIFVYRDEIYNEDSEDKNTAEIIVRKLAYDPAGTVKLAYSSTSMRFGNLEPEVYFHTNHN